jgi:flagellar biosynthesis anti-sigma factor FlgM
MSDIVSISSLNHAALAGSELHLDQSRAAGGATSGESAGVGNIAGGEGDSVALSSGAVLAHQALNSGADARASRVAELRQQIQSGQYIVDPQAVANAMLDSNIAGE